MSSGLHFFLRTVTMTVSNFFLNFFYFFRISSGPDKPQSLLIPLIRADISFRKRGTWDVKHYITGGIWKR